MDAQEIDPRRRMHCPISWCQGYTMDHGGYGDEPGDWTHTDSPGTQIAPDVWLYRVQIGTAAIRWGLSISDHDVIEDAADSTEIVNHLHELAHAIEVLS